MSSDGDRGHARVAAARAQPTGSPPHGRRTRSRRPYSIGPSQSLGSGDGGRGHPLDDLVEHRSASPTHRCLAPGTPTTSACASGGEPPRRLGRPQVVVELGHQRGHAACPTPPRRPDRPQWPVAAAATAGSAPTTPDRARAAEPVRCRTTSRPARSSGNSANSAYSMAAATSYRSASPPSKRALAGAPHTRRAPRVEPQHGQVGQGRQPPGRLAENVAVHHPAVRGQRVQADQRGHRRPVQRPGQLPDQPQTVGGGSSISSRRAGRIEFARICVTLRAPLLFARTVD